MTRNIIRFPQYRQLVAPKRAGFILPRVQLSDVFSPSRMHITAFLLTNSFVEDICDVSMRRCFKSLVSRHFRRK